MACPAYVNNPTNMQAWVDSVGTTTCTHAVTWSINKGTHIGPFWVLLREKVDSGSWATSHEWSTSTPRVAYANTDAALNHTYTYRCQWACLACGLASAWSNTDYTVAYSDTKTDTLGITDSVVAYVSAGSSDYAVTITDYVVLVEDVTGAVDFVDAATDTVTVTDEAKSGTTLKTNYKHYFGSNNGKVYEYGGDQKGYGTSVMPSYWKSKKLDFADMYPQYVEQWKTVYGVRLIYVDKDSHLVTVHLSNDGGVTWSAQARTIGTGSGKTKTADFHFIMTGQFFNIMIEHSSTDKTFQWTGMEVLFEPCGEYFEVS